MPPDFSSDLSPTLVRIDPTSDHTADYLQLVLKTHPKQQIENTKNIQPPATVTVTRLK